jgi:glucose-6-phosphate 1-dehydrogenase
MERPGNCIVTIFGASGDLTKRKLIPALFELYRQNLMAENFAILGVARTEYNDDTFRKFTADAISASVKDAGGDEIENFINAVYYECINTSDPKEYVQLKSKLQHLDELKNTSGNFIYYLATPPKVYLNISQNLEKQGLNHNGTGKKKIIIEKPFGYDLQSAKELNSGLLNIFNEEQVYRIDHYLGKETVQNVLVLRFSNGIFEPLWNRNFIDHVEITSAESIGVENRGGYYEGTGALRDMIQNHMLQITGFIAMEPPSSFKPDSVRDETLKVFQSLRRIKPHEVEKYSIRGQYTDSVIRGEKVVGYRKEKGVAEDSRTETYAAVKFFIDNWRWGGVPFYVRAGKKLPTRVTEVVIHFKKTPHHLFSKYNEEQTCNQLIIRIQPDEGILIKFGLKTPGAGYKIQTVNMDFHYSDISAENKIPSAYERLILDCMNGDTTLYTRGDAVEECWSFVDPILKEWNKKPDTKIFGYPAGTWGPPEANDLFENSKSEWRYPCKNLTDDGIYCEL